jgi:hypothetical protein
MVLVSIRKLLIKNDLPMPTLDLFGTSAVNVVHWQPKGSFGNDFSEEIKCLNDNHVQKSTMVVNIAIEKDCSLFLTAEYSFPYSVLLNIINTPERWPKRGALWCLSMEGIQRVVFDDLMSVLQRNDNIKPLLISRNEIDSERKFISALVYVFVLTSEQGSKKLCIVPQLKTHPSSDPFMEHERSQMILGKTIFYFDDEGNNAIFASLVCSDSFCNDNVRLFDRFTDKKMLIYNPQLNYSYLHQAEIDFYENILNYRKGHSLVIALNWAKGTGISDRGIDIQHGFSSIIRKPALEYNETAVMKNYHKGVCFISNKYKDIWCFDCDEHVLLYSVSSLVSASAHEATTSFFEPIVTDFLTFKDMNLVSTSASCIVDWDWFNRVFAMVSVPHTCNSTCGICAIANMICTREHYTQCCYKDVAMFCYSFFERSIENNNPFYVDNIGISGSYTKFPNNFTNDYNNIEESRESLEGIGATIVQKHRLPDRFKKFSDARRWLIGERTRNMRHISDDGSQTDAWIIYVHRKKKLHQVRSAINRRFSSNDDASLRNRILFCYSDNEQGFLYQDDVSLDIRDAKLWSAPKINLEGVK